MHKSIVVVAFAALFAADSLALPDLGSSAASPEFRRLHPRPLVVQPYAPERALPGPAPYWESDPLYIGPRHRGGENVGP